MRRQRVYTPKYQARRRLIGSMGQRRLRYTIREYGNLNYNTRPPNYPKSERRIRFGPDEWYDEE